jgi:polyisoprenoid-binding protein YceI
MKKMMFALFLALFTFSVINAQTKWAVDKSHSKVQFSVSHLVITDVTGQFKSFDASVEAAKEDFTDAQINFSVDIASINTENDRRDGHLKGDDFFNAEKYPKMTFVGKSLRKVGDNKYKLVGDLTIRDVTKSITLDVRYNGTAKMGNTVKAGFKITGEVNRFDYNLKWNALTEAGGAVVGKTVYITVDLELNKA